MATVGLYGSSSSGVVAAATGSESTGLYGNGTTFGGSYFEWFIFQVADTQPATPTGGSWSFSTNSGTPPTGWTVDPPVNPTNTVWVSIALVNSKNASSLTWSEPGKFSFASGLPILSGNGAPEPTDGQSDQLYIQLDTSPQTIWFKESGTWTRLTGSTLYVTASGNQTIAGTKTFSSTIQGSVSGTAGNVTGIVAIANGGTGATTASGARAALSAAQLGANADITSMTGLTGGISTPDYIDFDTAATPARATGRLWWDNSDGIQTLNLGMAGSNATMQIGEETYYRIKATSAITEGQVVMFTGTVGASGALQGAPAYALTADTASYLMGIATENISVNGWGYITAFGLVRGIDTTGGAEAWADGDILYYNPLVAGGLTNVVPAAPNAKIQVCAVVHAANNGSLFVRPTYGGKLGQFEGDVQISSPVANNSLFYTGTRWENYAPSAARTALGLGTSAVLNAGTANGVATLDAGGTVPLSQLPASIQGGVSYQGTWNASTNTPTLTSSVGTKGYYYVVSVAGSTNLNGVTDWLPGDWAIFNGTAWEKIDNTDAVSSVNGYTGAVSLTYSDVNAPSTTGTNASGTWAIDISGNAATATTSTNVSGGSASVTSLTNSGSTTLTSGTANGVAYLNGSKVLTTGSALTFDGTNVGLSGAMSIGGASLSTGNKLLVRSGLSDKAIGVDNGSNSGFVVQFASGLTSIGNDFNAPLAFLQNNSEQMRLTSTGLGIGTSSISWKLTLASGSGVVGFMNPAGNSDLAIGSSTNHPVTFWTNSSEQMRLTSTGLGIGTSSPAQKLDVRGGSIVVDTASAGLNPTVFFDHDNFASGTRNYIQMNRGTEAMLFGVANADRMTLDSSGNLGLGVTPSAWSNGKAIELAGTGLRASLFQSDSGVLSLAQNYYFNGGADIYAANGFATRYYQLNGQHVWNVAPSGTAGNAISFTQAMTLDASGTLLVGGTSVVGSAVAPKIYVENSASNGTGGIQIGSYKPALVFTDFSTGNHNYQIASDGGALTFGYEAGTAGSSNTFTERARIDSSGNLLVGTTSTSMTSGGFTIQPSSGQAYSIAGHVSGTGSGAYFYACTYGGSVIGGITQNGTTGVSLTTSSDYRLKNTIAPMTGALAKVAALKPCTYKWNTDGSDGEGFIAHELAEVCPQAVTGEKDAVDADGNPVYQGIDTSFLVATLTAALQELKAEVDALKSEINTLKGI